MDFLISLLFICGLCLPSGFVSSLPDVDVCDDEFKMFQCGIEEKCLLSLYPRPPLEVDGNLLDTLVAKHGNACTSILFYASWCPFSRAVRPKFDVLSSMFPQIEHLIVDQSLASPSVFSRYGIRSLPSILMVNQTLKIRYHGQKDLASLIHFYEETTGLKQVQYVDEGESMTNDNLITCLHNGSSIRELVEREPYVVLALMFLTLKLSILILPVMGSHLKTLLASYVPHLSLGILGETNQLFGRALHMIDVRRLWMTLRMIKTRNFQEKAKNALASLSLGKSTSQSA